MKQSQTIVAKIIPGQPTRWDAPAPKRGGMADWWDLYAKDHHFLRTRWRNLHQLDEMMWRSNQPSPKQVAQIAKMGIKNIVNLRGARQVGTWQLEAEACAAHNIRLYDFTARSRAAPDKQMLFDARELFASLEGPSLMHCKSGADRAGLMAALYMLVVKSIGARTALEQLSFKYLHVKQAKTGLLDAFLSAYIPYEDKGMPFYQWVEEIYDPVALQESFMTKGWANRLVDDILKRE